MAERHRLADDHRIDDPVAVTHDLVALHSSDPATVHLSAAVRMTNPSITRVEHALYDDRSLVRHHAMRRTLWVMTPQMAQLAHVAATEKIAATERKRTIAALRESTDLDDPASWMDHAIAEIVELLESRGPLPTRDIGLALEHLTIPVVFGVGTKHPSEMRAHTKLLQYAGFAAILVRGAPTGSWISSEYRWAPTESWLQGAIATGGGAHQPIDTGAAAGELLDHWLRRFGPATETDIKWWFGWTLTLTRQALASIDAEPVVLSSGPGFVAAGDGEPVDDPGPWVRLLPGLDPTVMGWKERSWYLEPAHVARLFDRNGNAGPCVLVDGRVVGGWGQRANGEICLELYETLGTEHQRLLANAIDELDALLAGVVVRPRFPAPVQRDIFAS